MADRRILVVEDDEDLAPVLAEALNSEYGVELACNGEEGLAIAEKTRPDLILLDLMMPVMDGWQFRDEQRRRPELANIPVIVFSADGHVADKAKELSVDGHLAKPIALDRLLEEVARVLEAR